MALQVSQIKDALSGLTFADALSHRRPMRRRTSGDYSGPWLFLGYEGHSEATGEPRWRDISSGRVVGLHVYDYPATDWEVMP